jgi:uncharacterized protein YndB with AHSA1/START domain
LQKPPNAKSAECEKTADFAIIWLRIGTGCAQMRNQEVAQMATSTDRIEKHVILKAPLARVWQAITRAKEFGTWFGMTFEGEFVAGQPIPARITPTKVDAEVAAMQASFENAPPFLLYVQDIKPMSHFSFRWHPYSDDPVVDPDAEPTTLVCFDLVEIPEGVSLTMTESGFDVLPPQRRAKAFTANEGGWTIQCRLIAAYLAGVRV